VVPSGIGRWPPISTWITNLQKEAKQLNCNNKLINIIKMHVQENEENN
jgi:hypothetical protein